MTASACWWPTSRKTAPPGPRARGGLRKESAVDLQAVDARVESSERLVVAHVRRQLRQFGLADVGRVADDHPQGPRLHAREKVGLGQFHAARPVPGRPDSVPPRDRASSLTSVARTRCLVSWARLRAIAPLPVPTSAISGGPWDGPPQRPHFEPVDDSVHQLLRLGPRDQDGRGQLELADGGNSRGR